MVRRRAQEKGKLACRTVTADEHGHLECLFVVESRIHRRLVRARKIRVREAAGTARAFGDVLARELDVYATKERAIGLVNLEREFELAKNVLEAARLESTRAGLGVAVHRVADPEHLLP